MPEDLPTPEKSIKQIERTKKDPRVLIFVLTAAILHSSLFLYFILLYTRCH